MAVAVAGTGALPGAPSAGAQPAPAQVTVVPGPATEWQFFGECSDVVVAYRASTSFAISRSGPVSDPLTVRYSTSGGVPGADYEPLPGEVVIPAGASTTTVPLEVGDDGVDRSRLVTVALTVEAGSGYEVGEPASTTIMFERRRDPALGPLDCNPEFQLLDVPENRAQTIPLGSVPVPIAFTGASAAMATVEGGSLPPGVTIPDLGFGATASFVGAATTVGTFSATLRVCPVADAFTCRTTVLTVTVVAEGAPPGGRLPVTGGTGKGTWLVVAALLAAALRALIVAQRRPSPAKAAIGR